MIKKQKEILEAELKLCWENLFTRNFDQSIKKFFLLCGPIFQ